MLCKLSSLFFFYSSTLSITILIVFQHFFLSHFFASLFFFWQMCLGFVQVRIWIYCTKERIKNFTKTRTKLKSWKFIAPWGPLFWGTVIFDFNRRKSRFEIRGWPRKSECNEPASFGCCIAASGRKEKASNIYSCMIIRWDDVMGIM